MITIAPVCGARGTGFWLNGEIYLVDLGWPARADSKNGRGGSGLHLRIKGAIIT